MNFSPEKMDFEASIRSIDSPIVSVQCLFEFDDEHQNATVLIIHWNFTIDVYSLWTTNIDGNNMIRIYCLRAKSNQPEY